MNSNHHLDLLRAAHFAARKHCDQRRKGEEASPYINHPIAVAETLARVGQIDDLPVLQAALLHDTVEDTDTTESELIEHFGEEVASLVLEVTDNKSLEKYERKQHQVDHAPFLTPRAKALKMADKINNISDIMRAPPAGWDVQRRAEYLDWAERVVSGCRDANAHLARAFDEALAEARSNIVDLNNYSNSRP
ncbi:MAG: HD domain-containing protein [Xanthomonadales bacterium]|nr:HD domain-containing protein [Xanthomonadales bacterium]